MFAPNSVLYPPYGDGSIIGRFYERDYGHVFEYSKAKEFLFGLEYDVIVWVGNNDFRYAKVLKTVAYIVVDEAADGDPVIDKWLLKGHRVYEPATFNYSD